MPFYISLAFLTEPAFFDGFSESKQVFSTIDVKPTPSLSCSDRQMPSAEVDVSIQRIKRLALALLGRESIFTRVITKEREVLTVTEYCAKLPTWLAILDEELYGNKVVEGESRQ